MLINGTKDKEQAMKRIFYLAAALLLAACSQETLPETSEIGIVETPEPKTYTVSLQATFAPETRLSFDTTNGVGKWDSTDKVALFTQNGKLVIGDIRGDFDEDSPTFTFTLEDDDKIVDGATVYYPASIAVENHPDQIVLPASYTDLDVMRKTIPMKATVNGKNMAFQHLASMVYVDAPTSTPSHPSDRSPQYVVFSVGEGNQPITGAFTVGDGSLTPAGDNGTEIRAKWDAGKGYCFVMPATTYSEGFSFSIISDITNVEGKEVYFTFYRKTRSSSFAAQRARMLKMPAFDPQCKEFYLTSTVTEWSDQATSARMIQTGPNSFLGALYSCKGSKQEWDLGLRILQKYNLGTHMHNTIGADGYPKATFGQHTGNFNGNPEGVYKVSITLNQDSWTYTSERVVPIDPNQTDWNHQTEGGGLTFVGTFDNWEQGGFPMKQRVGHNWYVYLTVSDSSAIKPDTKYEWKIKRNDEWKVNWGRDPDQNYGDISSSQLSSYLQIKDGGHTNPPNCTLKLPAGTYDVFFNDATGWIMFEKTTRTLPLE